MRRITLLLVLSILFVSTSIMAQFQVGVNGVNPIVFGDFTKKDFSDPSAGYVSYATGGNFEMMYHFKNSLGLGLRTNYNLYTKDIETYQADLIAELGVTENNFIMQSVYTYHSIGAQFAVSYEIPAGDIFSVEPYVYLGFNVLTSPMEEANYYNNGDNTTYTRKKPVSVFGGFNYSPGIRFQWLLLKKHLGIVLYTEYDGVSIQEWTEDYVTYSDNSFEKQSVEKDYSINAVNVGVGAFWRFGKTEE